MNEAMTAQSRKFPGRVEFVALMAMLTATVAFSIDAMLPGLPDIARELTPDAPNRAQLVVTSFLLGLGIGTFIAGPLSDSFGRKRIILIGAAIYVVAALLAMMSQSLWLLVFARVLQGLGASGARIVALAIARDLYSGREMARIISFVMMVFTIVPAIAPLIGTGIIAVSGWHGIFAVFILFAAISSIWLHVRLPEPLPVERRKAFRANTLWSSTKETLSLRNVRLSIIVQTFCFTTLFASISSIQPIIGESFSRAPQFPYWFFMIALLSGAGSLINAKLVVRFGMRNMINLALSAQICLSLAAFVLLKLDFSDTTRFVIYIAWQITVFFQASMTLGNLTSLAMEPLGHIAGMAASVMTGLATVGSVILTVPIGLSFDGSPFPLIAGVFLCMIVARSLMTMLSEAH